VFAGWVFNVGHALVGWMCVVVINDGCVQIKGVGDIICMYV
jgi:hypothetical protein